MSRARKNRGRRSPRTRLPPAPAPAPPDPPDAGESAWARYWYGPVAAVRPYLLVRAVLVLLAFDCWCVMMPHASGYGFGGFNVAHFAWLDAIHPTPSAAFYVGVLLLSGMLAFVGATTGARVAIGGLAALYTYGWAMSLMDSYQHHYLLSLFLFGFALLPWLGDEDVERRLTAWPYRLISFTLAVVYVFGAASKYEAGWRSTLGSLASSKPPFPTVLGWAATLGISPAAFWTATSLVVTSMELIVAAGYLLSTGQGASATRFSRRLGWIAWGCAVVLHAEVEVLGLQIGWFSYYMLISASVFFLPERWLLRAARVLAWPARRLGAAAGPTLAGRAPAVLAMVAGAGTWLVVGFTIDLPGGRGAGVVAAAAVSGAGAVALVRRRFSASVRYGLSGAVAAVACMGAMAGSSVRFDFYRYRGGDLERAGDLGGALSAYEKAEAYAPASASRQSKIDELRRRLAHPDP